MELVLEARVQAQKELNLQIADGQSVQVTRVEPEAPLTIKEIARYEDGMSEWDVTGGAIEKMVKRFDMTNHEAMLFVHRHLEQKGTLVELKNAGVKIGDLVHIGKIAFAFEE